MLTHPNSNRLARETSPYLLQHQDNPVDWYPWGAEALERAKAEDKPILLSVGYSACHWCHVMAHESFENPEIARLMNENFINIKVDREERPDLDQIYQNVAQAITRGGGWPLTVFLTPDLKPYFGGTYFPPEDRYGRPGFPRVLVALAQAYHDDREGILGNAEKLIDYMNHTQQFLKRHAQESQTVAQTPISLDEFRVVAQEALNDIDWTHGGFGGAPKFPNTMLLTFLWRMSQGRIGEMTEGETSREAILLSLDQMARGGIYDAMGGGFHRYSVDEKWSVPHFEKMLYDNGLLLKLYAEVLLTDAKTHLSEEQKKLYLDVLSETVQYVGREMVASGGAFFSAQDADSEGEEGKFFVWDRRELSKVLSEVLSEVLTDSKDLDLFCEYYGVTEAGNFEHGKTVLYRPMTRAFSNEEVARVRQASQKVFEARQKRIAPETDIKILVSWNALMISGLSWAAQALEAHGREGASVREMARKAFAFLEEKATLPGGRLAANIQTTKETGYAQKGNGFLDDYAFLSMAAIDLSRFANTNAERQRYLKWAEKWIAQIVEQFSDPDQLGYFFTGTDHEALIHRPKTIFDQAIPSGTAVALECMTYLVALGGSGEAPYTDWNTEIERQIPALFQLAKRGPFGFGEILCAALLWYQGPISISQISSQEKPVLSHWLNHPRVVIAPQPPAEVSTVISEAAWVLCHKMTCSTPMPDPNQVSIELKNILGQD